VIAHWRGGELVLENYATRISVAAPAAAAEVLDVCTEWRPVAAILARVDRFDPASVRRLVGALAAQTMLHRSDAPPDERETAMAAWGGWNPAAGFFHSATKDVRYPFSPAESDRRTRAKAKAIPAPPPAKRYPRTRMIALPPPRRDGELAAVLQRRRTWREFARAPMARADLATLLGLTWGIQRRSTIPGQGEVVFKTSPAGGARHPIEAYLLALRVAGVERGWYHYDAVAHRLERLPGRGASASAASLLGGQTWFGDAAAVVFMTAVFAREQWRYASPRAYRAVLLDAGHLCQTFCLLATSLDLAPFCTMALDDRAIERALGIDGISESVLYAAGVGTKKPGATSGAWPAVFRSGPTD
jgi:SagB-type dehydrogenase family enzyme